MTTSVSGIAYSEAVDLVETIVSIKKNKYNFPGTDPEDLAQDIRMVCWEALEKKFDPNKVGKSIFHFVARVVDNALYNKFRGIYLDNNPPCLRCPEYIKETKECGIDEIGCTRIVDYRNRMARKRAIASPLSYNSQLSDHSDVDSEIILNSTMNTCSQTGVIDLDETLRCGIDDNLIPYYEQMVNGDGKDVPAHLRRIIQQQVKIILKENES